MEQRTFIELPREMLQQFNSFASTPRKDGSKMQPNVSASPRTQRMPIMSEGSVFKFPMDVREISENTQYRPYSQSPRSVKENNPFYGENSDWMMAERMKPRTPPASPQTPSSKQGSGTVCRAASPAIIIEEHPQPSCSNDDDVIRCVPNRTQNEEEEDEIDHSSNVQRTPVKLPQNFAELRSPFRSVSRSPHHFGTSDNYTNLHVSESTEQCSSNKSVGNVEQKLEQLQRDFERRNARKQLNFDISASHGSEYGRDLEDLYFNSSRSRSPKLRRSSCESDDDEDDMTSELISKLLTQLQGRKRKASDRCRCDYDDECDSRDVFKRRRKDFEKFSSPCTSRQREVDLRVLRQQQEVADNCTCAVMERQFLKMAENAYKNIRRHDDSTDSFLQFRRELTETNIVLKDSMSILQSMRSVCDHRRLQ